MSRIAYSYLKIKEKTEASMSAARNCRELWPDDAVIEALANDLTTKAQDAIASIGPKNEKPLTEEMIRIESQRDNAFRAAVCYLESISLLPGNPHSEKAESILGRLNGAGLAFLNESYIAETAILNKHLEWLDKEENKAIATEIGFNPWIEAIRSSNENFLKILDERNLAKESRPPRIDTVEPVLNKSLMILWSYVEAHKGQDKAEMVFADFYTAIANEKARRTRKNSKDNPPA